MFKKILVAISASTFVVVLLFSATIYFMPDIFFSHLDMTQLVTDFQPGRYTLPIVVKIAEREHRASNEEDYSKASPAPKWADLISSVRDRRTIPYLKKLSGHSNFFISKNAVQALTAMGENTPPNNQK